MSQNGHPSSVQRHAQHSDERTRVKALERQERHAAQRSLIRTLRTMVQPHEPHHYHAPAVEPVSPRRAYGSPAAPGGTDNTGFCDGAVC
jgi:hypothetical protein